MKVDDYLQLLNERKKISDVKEKIIRRLWGNESDSFPKLWVSSTELLELTGQKYFDRRTRELRDQLGCDIETTYSEAFSGHAWRIHSAELADAQDREYLTRSQKNKLFQDNGFTCVTCGIHIQLGVRGLQADHKVPISRGGGNELRNWQPMCNNCNVGKRRACEGCSLDCQTCSWAFPEKYGVRAIFAITKATLRRIDRYAAKTHQTPDQVIEAAANYYLDEKAQLKPPNSRCLPSSMH